MDWVSFDEIKRLVPLKAVLDHYGVPLRKVGPNTLRGKCPLPTHTSQGKDESFTATLDKGIGGAWACQSQSCIKARGRVGGNVLDFVAAKENCSVRDAAIKLQSIFLVPAAGPPDTSTRREPAPQRISSAPEAEEKLVSGKNDGGGESEPNKPLTFTLQKIDYAHPYLAERGITEETARNFGVGFFPGKGSMSGRVVIPIHNGKGELVAYAGRSIDGTEPRYKFPVGFHKSLELFNLDRVRDQTSVVVVEGFFDCMKVSQAGYPCVALMGCSMSRAQGKLLAEHFGQVVLMLDGDEAGRGAAEESSDRLQRVVFQVKTVVLDDGVQPDQLSPEEIRIEIEGVLFG
jgi:DNA primase